MQNNFRLGVNHRWVLHFCSHPFQHKFDYYILVLCFANCAGLYLDNYVFRSMLLLIKNFKLIWERSLKPEYNVSNFAPKFTINLILNWSHKQYISYVVVVVGNKTATTTTNTLLTPIEGRREGKRGRGRPRRTWFDDLRDWTESKPYDQIKRAAERRNLHGTFATHSRGRNTEWITTNKYLWKLLSNVAPNKDSLQVDPQILYDHPVLKDVIRVRQVWNPQLYQIFERCIIPATRSTNLRKIRVPSESLNLATRNDRMLFLAMYTFVIVTMRHFPKISKWSA